MKDKLNLEKMAEAINYYEAFPTFYKKGGNVLTEEDLESKDLCPEDNWPFTIKDFKKLGFGFSHVIYDCQDGDNNVLYVLDNETKTITIEADKFTIKEFFIIVDMINRHLMASKSEQFVAFGNDNDEKHTLFHGEATAFGMWWEDFYNFFMDRINGIYQLKRIHIETDDYKTEDKKYYTKDRVIRIVFE